MNTDEYIEYAKTNPSEFEWEDENGQPYSMPYPVGIFDGIRADEKLRTDAQKRLNTGIAGSAICVSEEECSLTSIKHFQVLEELIAGESREVIAKRHSIAPSSVNRILYSPQSRRTIATIINGANQRLASNMDLMLEVAANQLMTLMTTGDSKQRLAAIDRTFKFYEALNKMGLAAGAKATQTRTVKNNDGSVVDKMTVTGKVRI